MKYSHYYKTLPCLTVDVYRVLHAFEVNDPCIQHSIKKLLVAGGRGAKDAKKDVEEAIDSLVRWLEMRREEQDDERPPLQPGDQIAWNHGDGWQYVTLKDSDLPNMQGNDLKVSICDTMNLADSFLKSTQQEVMDWGRELKPVNVRMQYSLDGVTWHDSKDGGYAGDETTIQARIHPDDDLRWGEHHEARMDVIGQNGPTGEHYDSDKEQRIDAAIENLSKFAEQDDGWVAHRGSKQPVPDFCRVDVRFSNGKELFCRFADEFEWNDSRAEPPIVAYRIRNEIYNDDEEAQV